MPFDTVFGMIAMVAAASIRMASVIVPIDFGLGSSYEVPTVLKFGVLGIVPFDTVVVFDVLSFVAVVFRCSGISSTKRLSSTSSVVCLAF